MNVHIHRYMYVCTYVYNYIYIYLCLDRSIQYTYFHVGFSDLSGSSRRVLKAFIEHMPWRRFWGNRIVDFHA